MRINFGVTAVFRYLVKFFLRIKKLTIEYTSFYKSLGMWCCKAIRKTMLGLLIGSTKLPNKRSDSIAHIFYFYIFEKEKLQTDFKHNRTIRTQANWP